MLNTHLPVTTPVPASNHTCACQQPHLLLLSRYTSACQQLYLALSERPASSFTCA